jgi:hypothetical protein
MGEDREEGGGEVGEAGPYHFPEKIHQKNGRIANDPAFSLARSFLNRGDLLFHYASNSRIIFQSQINNFGALFVMQGFILK